MSIFMREILNKSDEARTLLRAIFTTEADLMPNEEENKLIVRIHHLANPLYDEAANKLCNHLNDTKVTCPGTNIQIVYEMVS